MKFDPSCMVFKIFFSKFLVKFYNERVKDVNIKDYIRAVKKEYKEMILRTPSLSKDNYMAGNLKGAAYFFAVAKVVPGMTPSLMDEYIDYLMTSDTMKRIYKKARETGKLFSKSEQEKMAKDAIRSEGSTDEMDWKYTYEGGVDEVKYTITKCGVCRLAQREDLLEFLPCMCKMDYQKYDNQGAILKREKTLANKDEYCDFHLIRKK